MVGYGEYFAAHPDGSIQKLHCDYEWIKLSENAAVRCGIQMILTRCKGAQCAKEASHAITRRDGFLYLHHRLCHFKDNTRHKESKVCSCFRISATVTSGTKSHCTFRVAWITHLALCIVLSDWKALFLQSVMVELCWAESENNSVPCWQVYLKWRPFVKSSSATKRFVY